MRTLHEKLRDAAREQKRVTVTEKDGTVHEDCAVDDASRVRTESVKLWRFVLRCPEEEKLYSTDLKAVEVLDGSHDQ